MRSILEKVDAILLSSPYSLRYHTGFSGGEGIALMSKTGNFLFVDSRYTEAAEKETTDFVVVEFGGGKRNQEIAQRIEEWKIGSLGYEEDVMTLSEYRSLKESIKVEKWVGCSRELRELRMIKSEDELAILRTAEQIGVDAYLAVLPQIKEGMTENELAAELEYQMRKRGAEGTAFETIAISGKKTSMPHGKPDNTRITYGDFITMDFGCKYQGYCSDMTRTVVFGKATEEQKKIYETVRLAQETGLGAIRSGILGKEADAAARKIIEDAGFGKYFGHSLGHGVGLEIHELPNLSPLSEFVLKPGMVVTCEPGIYIPDFGGVRIEDMVCIGEDGCENFTHLAKELIEL